MSTEYILLLVIEPQGPEPGLLRSLHAFKIYLRLVCLILRVSQNSQGSCLSRKDRGPD